MLILFLLANFATQYEEFVNSPQKDSIFTALTRKDVKITDFAENPVVLWFWRNNSDDPNADSLLVKITMDRSYYISAVLRWEAREAKSYDSMRDKLYLALHYDPRTIENFFSLISLSIRSHQIEHLIHALTLPILSDFRNQAFLITNIFILIFIALIICSLIFILVKVIFYLPLLSHRLDPQKHYFLKGILPFLIMLIPVLVLRNVYIIYVFYGLILLLVLSDHEKTWLRLSIGVIALLTMASFPLNQLVPFLKGTSKPYDLYRLVNYDGKYRIAAETAVEKELLALALKQQGATDEALSIYEELYYNGNRNLSVVNNLANLYFLYDEDNKAEELYKQSLFWKRGEPYYNLGLLKLKNIEYLASSEYMEKARQNGFSSIAKEPVDIKPNNRVYYQILIGSKGFQLPWFINPLYILPLIALFIFSFLRVKFSTPYFCVICGQAVCKRCLEESDEEGVCSECINKIKSTKSSDIEEDLRISLSRNKRIFHRIITYLLNVIVPGAGLIYQGHNFTGLLIVFFVAIAYIPLLLRGLFIKPAGWISLPLAPIFILVTIIILFLAYLFSFTFLRGTVHAD